HQDMAMTNLHRKTDKDARHLCEGRGKQPGGAGPHQGSIWTTQEAGEQRGGREKAEPQSSPRTKDPTLRSRWFGALRGSRWAQWTGRLELRWPKLFHQDRIMTRNLR